MQVLVVQQASNLKASTVIVPETDERSQSPSILPQRFGSTSAPTRFSILAPEFTSASEPQASPVPVLIP